MNSALQELKSLLLSKSTRTFNSTEQGIAIVNTLQSLLKVAEMRNKCCFFEDCAHPTLAVQNKFSLNISFENDKLLLLTGQSITSNGLVATEFDGQSDEDSSSTDNSYETADEGYDADGEAAKFADTDCDSMWSQSSKVSTPPFRTHIVHEGICKIVIEILIDLSKRCLENPSFWPNQLMQIATRLGSIREILGGSLYIVKGFATVLESNDMRLRDFQKSVLDLITDLNTPDTLSAYLSLMTSPNPPLDVLLPRLVSLGGNAHSVHPSVEIEFPVPAAEDLKNTCDPLTFDDIRKIYDYHDYHKIKSPMTQAAYISPLNYINFKPWTNEGFTLTSWLRISPNQGTGSIDSDDFKGSIDIANGLLDDDFQNNDTCSHHCFYRNKLHLLSVGTNSLLLSIYLSANDVNTFHFQLTNPSAQVGKAITKSHSDNFRCPENALSRSKKTKCICATMKKRRTAKNAVSFHGDAKQNKKKDKENNLNHPNGDRVSEKLSPEQINTPVSPTTTAVSNTTTSSNVLSDTIRTTRMALKSSLSHFNLFTSARNNDNEVESNFVGFPVELKGVKLHKNRWTLFSMSSSFNGTEIRLQIRLDNSTAFVVNLPCSHANINARWEKFKVICIGHKYVVPSDQSPNSTGHSLPSVESEVEGFTYSLSNILLFRKRVIDDELLHNLYAFGPDCVNFTQCQIGNIIPNLGISSSNKLQTTLQTSEVTRILRKNLISVYSAHKPNVVLGYSNLDDSLESEGDSMGMIILGEERSPKYVPSFQSAVFLSGGLSSMLYLFARVVELSTSDVTQAVALQFFLKIAHSNSALYTEFVKKSYISLLGPIIRSDKCLKTIHLVNAILETACSGPVISKGPEGFEVLTAKHVCIIYPELFIAVINHYSDWHKPNADNCEIIEILFSAIQCLVSEKHTYQAVNIARLSKANLVSALFNFCKVHLTGGSQQIFWSQRAAESLVNTISVFAGAPPVPAILDDIIKVLLMLHRPSDSYVTHDRSKFYFLLTSAMQQKAKKLSLPLSARKLSLSIKKNQTIPTPSPLHRSASLGQSLNTRAERFMRSNSEIKNSGVDDTIIELLPLSAKLSKRHSVASKEDSNPDSSDQMEPIAGCSNIERKSSVILTSHDKAKFERALSQLNMKRQVGSKKRLRKPRAKPKTRRRSITESEGDNDKKAKRNRKRSVSDSGIDLALIREYDIIADEDIQRIDDTLSSISDKDENRTLPPISYSYESCDGIIHVQNGLLDLLRDFILILPDNEIEEVLSHYVTLDIVLVLANSNNSVRASIIRLLTVMCERHNVTTKTIYFHHLGNQIALHPTDFTLVQACVQWVTGSSLNLDQLVQTNDFKVVQKCGLNSLMAIIPQTLHDVNLARSVFQFISQLYKKADQDSCAYMVENGLVPVVVKSLAKVFIKYGTTYEKLIDTLQSLMNSIALKALSTAGCIHVLWDLLNSITYIELNRNGAIYRGIRSVQATILLFLLKSFFHKRNNPSLWNFKFSASDINLTDCVLSTTEKRTRFDLLLDRIVQFLRNAQTSSYVETTHEIKLIECVVMLSVNGQTRGSSIIPWSFRPGKPMPLKLYIVKLLWKHAKNGDLPLLGCDGKLVKTMIHAFLHSDREIIPQLDLEVLNNVCNALGIQQSNSNPYLSQGIEKMDAARENSLKEQRPSLERTVYKFEQIAQNCIESAMKITRNVVEIQNAERRNAIANIRVHDESCLDHEWNSIMDRMTHEGAPWHCARTYPNCWELDPTEGPSRVRIRMRRCTLKIPPKFFLNPQPNGVNQHQPCQQPLSYLKSTLTLRPDCTLSDQVLYTFPCKHLPIDVEIDGEMIITESNVIFIANDGAVTERTINVDVNNIADIWLRRYQHNDNAIEFFLESNQSIFFIFQSTNDREKVKVYFADKVIQYSDTKLNIVTQQWREGQLSNWEYLTALNLISGRTYQDLMQYPIFPWILSDYESSTLDLSGVENYRDLSKPIAIQHPENEDHYVNSYNYLNTLYTSSAVHQLAPYHYGSHYSNSGTVLHFLVRVPPFTSYFLRYQDNNFDLPDRTFHSILTTWRLASRDSTTDVKELVPEFFSFHEFLENSEHFNFGLRQSGEMVDNVQLPSWARDSPRLFILIHRQALESDVTKKHLNKWIDLVFGWRQTGQAAVDAINVFHPATYYGFSSSEITDTVEKTAMETMVRTYGQMPRTLFKSPHPIAQLNNTTLEKCRPVLPFVKGLRWGCYTGSPELPDPRVCCIYQQFEVSFSILMTLSNTNVIYAFSLGHNVMQGSEQDTMNIIQWKQTDGIVRIKPLRDSEMYEHQPLTYNHHIDEITTCGTDPNCNQLWFGHQSGRITVYQCNSNASQTKYNKNRQYQHFSSTFNKLSYNSAIRKISVKFANELDSGGRSNSADANSLKWKDPVVLVRHTNTITSIHISKEFRIVVSVSNDGFAVIWDANNLQYVRSIQKPSICKGPITLVTVSPTLGDIVTVHTMRDGQRPVEDDRYSECCEATENIDDFVNVAADINGKALMRVHTINAKYISHITLPEKILSVCYSSVKEGTGVNVIATGLENGIVRLWSSWDLTLVREFMVSTYDVISIAYSTYQHLVVLTSDNIIQVWDSPGLHGNPPKFPQVVFQKPNGV